MKTRTYENSGFGMCILGLALAMAALGGCAAVHTSIARKDLDVKTRRHKP